VSFDTQVQSVTQEIARIWHFVVTDFEGHYSLNEIKKRAADRIFFISAMASGG